MKTMLLAASAALSLGIGSAYADANSSGGTIPNTFFTQLPGVNPTPPVQHVPAATTAQGGPHAYVTQWAMARGCSRRMRAAAATAKPPGTQRKGRHHCRPFSFGSAEPATGSRHWAGCPAPG